MPLAIEVSVEPIYFIALITLANGESNNPNPVGSSNIPLSCAASYVSTIAVPNASNTALILFAALIKSPSPNDKYLIGFPFESYSATILKSDQSLIDFAIVLSINPVSLNALVQIIIFATFLTPNSLSIDV